MQDSGCGRAKKSKMPRARKTQKNAEKTKVVEPCKTVETNKRKSSGTDGSAAPNKRSKKGMKTIAVGASAEINGSVEAASQEADSIEASIIPKKKTKKGSKAAALKEPMSAKVDEGETMSDERQVMQEPTIQAGKQKKGAKKAAASGESSVIHQNQKKTVETAKTVTKKEEGLMINEAAEEPNREVVTQQEHEIIKVSAKNKRGAKAAEVKEQVNGEAIPQEENEITGMPEKKKKKGGSGIGETKKQANAEAVQPGDEVGGGLEKKVKKKAKAADAKKIGKTAEVEPTPEIPRKEGANEAGPIMEEVNKKKGRKQPAVEKPTGGIAVEETGEEKDVADTLTTVPPKPKRGRKPATTKKQANAVNSETEQPSSTIYDFTVKDADDNDVSLAKYKGHPVLIVNVASRCGHTKKNYTQLKELYDKYKEQGLRIATFPCNQFGGQEPGVAAEIKRNIAEKYGFEPDFYAKIAVNGAGADPLYKFLKNEQGNNEAITWNFAKFLVDKDGYVVKRYLPKIQPKDLTDDIETLLQGGKL
uniref:Glutathione peroxidase n=1 Tax=Ascaris suum TaxID=6253 RepID=F1KVF2_ASCSU